MTTSVNRLFADAPFILSSIASFVCPQPISPQASHQRKVKRALFAVNLTTASHSKVTFLTARIAFI